MSTLLTDSTPRPAHSPAAFKIQFDFFATPPDRTSKRPRPARTETPLKVMWKWGPVEQEGAIRNISTGGCFIETAGEVSPGDKIQFRLSVPGLLNMQMEGMVVRKQRGEGFALRFGRLSATEQSLLAHAIKHLSRQAASEK